MNIAQRSKRNGKSLSISGFITKYKFCLLRISIGIIFFWFGFLKFFPGLSPAQELSIQTINALSFGLVPDVVIIKGLAFWEVLIGIGLITGKFSRLVLALLFLHMAGTFAPLFLFPDQMFTHAPYGLTFKGQYIIKNLVLVAAAIVLGSESKKA